MWRCKTVTALTACLTLFAFGCSGDEDNGGSGGTSGGSGSGGTSGAGSGGSAGAGGNSGSSGAGGSGATCPTTATRFEAGDATGSTDPYGARAAQQARAGRLTSEAMIVQPAHGRQRIHVGDFVLANEHIAAVIEDRGLSDGYARFGGELLALDSVGADGRPEGRSRYIETLMALSIEMIDPDSVTVINDGSDGHEAVVRVQGPLTPIPFLNGALAPLFPHRFGLYAAYDYVLAPGSEKLLIRVGIVNPSPDPVSFGSGTSSDVMHGFFHASQNQLVTTAEGFAAATGRQVPFAGYVNADLGFAWRAGGGGTLKQAIEVSGFQYFLGPSFTIPGCAITWVDHAELIAGGPEYDGLREAVRRVDGEPAWRAISGTVRDAAGAAVPGAWIHELDATGTYLSRTRAAIDGTYTVHAPPGAAVKLHAVSRGYPLGTPDDVPASDAVHDFSLGATGSIHVTAHDGSGAALPVRVQVIPSSAVAATPEEYGVEDERRGRLHVDFAMTGDTTLRVPPGEHQVVVSRGSEWEIDQRTVSVTAGQVVDVATTLEHSVDTTGVMCADFHIHSNRSADSNDDVTLKVKSAISDGLDIPVSSEHEWVLDFQPVITDLGLSAWAFGMPSEELTTFTWGHFGVVPLTPRPDQVNNGAVEWIGKEPPAMFDAVRTLPEQPVFIINHPSGGGFGAYFSSAGYDRDTGAGDPQLWSTNFDAIEVCNSSDLEHNRDGSIADWFSLLNAGETFWGVGSSDSHHLQSSPVGYPRTCLALGTDDPTQLTAGRVRDVLAAGHATISGGLYLTVAGPGGASPGDTVTSPSATQTFTVTTQAPSWLDASTLEIIVDGETQATVPLEPLGSGTARRWVNVVDVTLDTTRARNWVLFHVRGDGDLAPVHPGRQRFALSNPIFFGR